ncbi:MAG: hypothetical protein V1749_12190 [Candidatus Desantisbacteria bacterium]
MSVGLEVGIRKKSDDIITLEIKKKNFEAFSNAVGLFRKGFFDILDASERDSKEGRIKERKSLLEIVND